MIIPAHTIQEIAQMVEVDQTARRQEPIDWGEVAKIDKDNTAKIKEIVTKYGWPKISEVGERAAFDSWLLVQHADHDPEFQRYCLNLMTELPKEEISSSNLALLTDRVMMKEKGVQKYGTQLLRQGSYLIMAPVEDLNNLDKLRKDMDLKPIREYLAGFNKPAYLTQEEYEANSAGLLRDSEL